jgi:lipopolysaccharide transport system permease protein
MVALFNIVSYVQALRELLVLLMRHRKLTVEMAKREIADRYLGQVFGILWALGHPLILVGVYVFIFAYVFRVKIGGTRELPLDYTTYLLSGLIPWLSFQESMAKNSVVIISYANLVKQVVFPIEVLPVKGVLASLISQIIFLALLLLYIMGVHHVVPWTCVLLPVLILCQAMAMVGVSYILAAIGTYFRDVKDLVQVFNTVGLYLVPVLYLPAFVPEACRPLLYLNPFSYLIWCYQDAVYFGRFEHPWAWPISVLLSVGVFVIGYRLFRKLKVMFGNVL